MSMYFAPTVFDIHKLIPDTSQGISRLSESLGINLVIGLLGYLLRFFAISRLDPLLYASLSYFGIVMAFVYGIFLNGDIIDIKKIAGAVLIIISNLILMRDYVGI